MIDQVDLTLLHSEDAPPNANWRMKDKLNGWTSLGPCRFLEWSGWYNYDVAQRLLGHYRLFHHFKADYTKSPHQLAAPNAYILYYRSGHGFKYFLSRVMSLLYSIFEKGRYPVAEIAAINRQLVNESSGILYDFLTDANKDFTAAFLQALSTPELLVRRADRQVSALVLGGTAPRGGDAAQDEALGSELLASAKNNEEHAYAVASIRDALGPLCDALEVQARPGLLKFPNLQHLGTQVHGTLADSEKPKSALALAAAVHPPAAVCGTPTSAALELIRELEHMDRQRYAGPVGWVDAEGNGEWGIALRCAQLSGRTARLFAGCGIVAGSEPAAELAETLVKFQPMRGALEDGST